MPGGGGSGSSTRRWCTSPARATSSRWGRRAGGSARSRGTASSSTRPRGAAPACRSGGARGWAGLRPPGSPRASSCVRRRTPCRRRREPGSRRASGHCGSGSRRRDWTLMPAATCWRCCASSTEPPAPCRPMRPWSWSAMRTSPAAGGSSSTARWVGASTSPGRWRSGSGCTSCWGCDRRPSWPTTASSCRSHRLRATSRGPGSSPSTPRRSPPWCAAGSRRQRCSRPGSASAPPEPCSCPPPARGTARRCGCSGSKPDSCSRPPASSGTSPSAWRRRASASSSTTTCPRSPTSWSVSPPAGCASSRPSPVSRRPSPTRCCSGTRAP